MAFIVCRPRYCLVQTACSMRQKGQILCVTSAHAMWTALCHIMALLIGLLCRAACDAPDQAGTGAVISKCRHNKGQAHHFLPAVTHIMRIMQERHTLQRQSALPSLQQMPVQRTAVRVRS